MSSEVNESNNNLNHIPIEESILSTTEMVEKVIATNDLWSGLKELEPFVDKSLYHNFAKVVGLIIIAVSDMKQEDIDQASKAVENFAKLTNKFRKHGILISAMKMIKVPNYQKYSDLELHAELLHTYYIAISALMCAINTYNIYGLIKVAYRLQKFVIKFKYCRIILKKRKEWDNETSRINFEAGVRLANGLKHLAISQIPPKILRIINFLGYRGKESIGFEEINKTAFELSGFGSRCARGFLIGYWIWALPHGALIPDLTEAEKLLNKELAQFPKSMLCLGAKAKLAEVRGNIDECIEMLLELMKTEFVEAHKAIHFELIFCYALKCDWSQCIKYSELLRKETTHSPVLATYAEAAFRYIKSMEDNDVFLKQQASKLMETIPNLRIRHLGKTLTPEKMAVENSIKYFKNHEFLILPEMDILYQGNWLAFIKGNQQMMSKFMERVEKEINHFKDDIMGSDYLDNYLTATFYKGVINKLLGKYSEAKELFNSVLKEEFSIPVQAVLELGLVDLEQGNYESAKKWLNKAINDYSGYLYENIVHLRAYAGLRAMGVSTDKNKEDDLKLEQYKKEWLKDINIEEKSYETILQNEEEIVVK